MQLFVGGQNELTLVTLLQNSAKITKIRQTEDILGKFGLQESSCIPFWLKTVSSCRKMQIFVGGQNELTLVTLLQNSAKINKIRQTEEILGNFGLQASSCIHFWLKRLKTVSSCRKMQLFVGGQNQLTLVTLLQNSAKITKIRQTEDILCKFALQASSCIHFWLKTVSSCRKMQLFVGGQNELTLVTLLQNSAKITKNCQTEDILGKFGLQASSCIPFWLKPVSSCRKMQIFVGGQNELTLVTLLQNSAKITKIRQTEDILGNFALQASSCIHFWLKRLKTVSSCRKMQLFVGGQNQLTLVTLLQNSAKITKIRQTEDILGKFALQASSCIHFWLKTVSSCRKMQIFVGCQNELTLVTLLQNSAKITKIRQTEDILGKFALQASSCIHFWLKTVSSCRKMQFFVGGQNELTLVTLLQNSAKITKNCQTEDILGKFGLQASSCIPFWLKPVNSCRKMQIFVGGQNELTLVTLLQNSAKITKNRHTEDILGKFGLQASSCIHFWLKTVSSCRKMQIFVGGQNELTLVTLLQNSAKITKNCQTEDILGKFGLQASSCIPFWLKPVSSCRKMQIFVGCQNELTLVTLLQNSAKITKIRQTEDILGKFALQASSCIHFWLKTVSSCRKMQFFVGGQNELTLVTLLQNSAKITKNCQTEDILGKFGLQASSCIPFWLKPVSSCRKMQIFVGGQNELTLVTLLQNSAKITKIRQTEDILGKFALQASSCIHFWLKRLKTVSSCRKMQLFVGGQNQLTLVTLLQNSAKITKIRQTEDILGKFALQASSCIHFLLKTVSSCRKMQIFVGCQNELTLVTLLQNSAKITKNCQTEDILGKFALQASSCIHFWLKRLKTVSSCRKMQLFVGGQNQLTLVTLLQNSAKITKIRQTEDILGKFALQASSCIHFWLKTVSSCRKMQIFVGCQNELSLVTLLQNSAKITKNCQTEDILGKFALQASSCIHFWLKRLKTVSSCRKMQLFVGGQNQLTLVTLLQNSAKITRIRQTEDILGKFALQASSCIHFWLKTVSSCRKMQIFVGCQSELTLVTLLQNSAKITKFRQTEDILGKFALQASSCIHFWLKTVSSCRKMQFFVGGQNELTLVTLLQNSAKITKNCQTEDILGKFGLQASSCIPFWLKPVSSCRKMQIFVGGQNELTLVTLLQNSAKITKIRQTEDILGKFALKATSCIHFWLKRLKTVSSCRKMQLFVGGQNQLTLVTLLQNSAKITKIRQTEDILGKFALQASSCIHFWLKTVSSCRKMQIFVGCQNELTLVTLLQNSAKITKNCQTEDILGKFGLQASSCIPFWLKTVSSCRKMQIFVGGQNELTLVTLLQNSAKITKSRHTEDILGEFALHASSCNHFWLKRLKTVSSCRKMQIFVGGQNQLTLVTLLQNSAKITKIRQTEDILGKFALQASSCIHFWLKTVSSCRKMQIFVGCQNELTLVTLLQNSAKITKNCQTEDILGKFALQASSCIHFWLKRLKTVSSCRKMQLFVGGQNQLTLVTLLQNSAKITKIRQTEDILGKFALQASSCIHFWLKTVSSCRKMQIFVGCQSELTLVTLLQNSAKITKIRQTEDILGKFALQASSCIHFWLKTVSSCRKMQIFVGGQNELTLVTLLQNSAKITKIRQTEDILGKFALQASSCIHFWLKRLKTVSSCRKMQLFVGGQNQLTLVTLLQNSAKITKIRQTEDILCKFALQASSCIHFWLKTVSSCRKMQIFVGCQNELTLVTLLQNSAKITKNCQTEDILGKFGLQASSCIPFWRKTVSSCRKMQIFVGGQNELTLVTLLQNSAKITKSRHTEDILGEFALHASSCNHFWLKRLKTVSSCRKMQIFVGGQNELTLVTLLQNSAKITKIRQTENILGKFALQASSCIHFWLKRLKTVSSCRKMQLFVGGQNQLTLETLLQNSAKITKNCQTEDILGKFGLQASSCIPFWLKTVSSCRKMQIFVGGQNELTLVTLLQNSAKITKIRQTEDILGKFGLQASSCIPFWLKTVSSCRNMQIFVGGQNELTLVTLLQNSAKINKIRQTEEILGNFGLQASSCLHFWLKRLKTVSSCRKMHIFVGGQNQLTLVTLLQNSAKITKIRQTEDILGKFALQASSCIHFWLKTVSSCRKMQIFVGGQNELTLVTLLQNSAKITKIRQTEDILGKFGLQASSCIPFWLKTVSSCRKMQIFVGGQNELTLVTLLQNSAKITKIRQTEDILGKFGLQASSCIHFWLKRLKTVSSCRNMQIFVGGQNQLTLETLLQNSAKITKNCQTEDILGKFGLQASSCIPFWLKKAKNSQFLPKNANFCRWPKSTNFGDSPSK